MKKFFTLILCGTTLTYAHSQVVISQVYGAGGNAGATYRNDYVELYNNSGTTVSLNNYTLQYANATGSFNTGSTITSLSGNIYPNSYYLIQLGTQNGSVGAFIPAADAIGTINIGTSTGKLALVSNATPLGSTCPTSTNSIVVDFFGYGTTVNCSLGSPATSPSNNTTAMFRKNSGTINSNNNFNDFEIGTVNPRNIALPLQLISFSATPKESNVAFAWKTSNERNTHHFEVEQSFDGITFKSIATVAAAGNSTTEKSYNYTGNLNATTTYYRLKTVDIDSKSSYSSVLKVAPSKTGFSLGNVYPIPAKSKVTVEWNSKVAGATTLTLTDFSGHTIKTLKLQSTPGFNQYQLDINAITSGQYFLRLKNDINQVQTIITKQ